MNGWASVIEHWQAITGTASIIALLGLVWRVLRKLLVAQFTLSLCEEREQYLKVHLEALRNDLAYYSESAHSSADSLPNTTQTATSSSGKSKLPGRKS